MTTENLFVRVGSCNTRCISFINYSMKTVRLEFLGVFNIVSVIIKLLSQFIFEWIEYAIKNKLFYVVNERTVKKCVKENNGLSLNLESH